MIRGIRGAATAENNSEEAIWTAAEELFRKMAVENKISPEQVSSVIITATPDLNAAFPAKALRELKGWTHVPVMCMSEIDVPGSLEKCIRVMMHTDTEKDQQEIRHIYLGGAEVLRPDLQKSPGLTEK
ncbi:chorismate mutase [Bacillus mangrovi]|uniref:chorismate mutase n=1 Tax=Metabacillus mangrovi TaxID=1491830 RepID=A0A7X2S1U1_9BACI|nr:chorismate mutase [Metabacillus mangrovi]MTH52173.1 chorismate mutase [Metabacillus mangrovi]